MTDDFLAGVPTRHAPLLGVGAALDRLMGGAELYARQNVALEAARDALDDPCVRDIREQVRAAVDAYLRSMRESERPLDPVERPTCEEES
jgi:hypothetical protein